MIVKAMMTKRVSVAVLVGALVLTLAAPSRGQQIDGASAAQLRQWLKENPQADAIGHVRLPVGHAPGWSATCRCYAYEQHSGNRETASASMCNLR